MSLLLDALKRAEQEKLAKQGERPANDAGAAPAPAAAPKRESGKAGALELQPIAGAAPAAPPAQAAKPAAAATAQAVFQAKAAPAKAEGERNFKVLWIAGVLIVLAIIGIGGYVWWSLSALQPKRDFTTVRSRAAAPAAAAGTVGQPKLDTLVPGAVAPATPRPDGAGSGSVATLPPATTTSNTTTTSATAAPSTTSDKPRTEESAPAPRTNAELAARLVKEAPPAPSLRLAPAEKARVPSEIANGYDALRSGDLPAARRSYTAALAADSNSLDAVLGLATVEARLGNVPAAASLYRRALDLDPRNATALAGLASMADLSQPETLETQLRADLARYPQSAALHFALGNLYASRGRWEEAQSSFFEALRIEPASADTLYNLAVAMDHMGQQRLAVEYYKRALDAARTQAAQFDPSQAARRLAELRP